MPERVFGEIPGVPEGKYFASRLEASRAGVHRPTQGGISGSAKEGADSIVVSGGYEDDQDKGLTIEYIGHGGRDPETGEQIEDQPLSSGNLALIYSFKQNLPVRVVRGANSHSSVAPRAGYRYDGLYRVVSYQQKKGRSGYLVWCFSMEKIDATTIPWKAATPRGLTSTNSGSTKKTGAQQKAVTPRISPTATLQKKTPANLSVPQFKIGEKVRHESFGEGIVNDVKSSGPQDYTVTVSFASVGTKKLLASMAKLERIS